ncbi:MAG: hydroxymethylglutaryl-CoA lyase [Chitinophagaceae bacterium]|nr:hydroxymethylglutaryl-CoA lyase [Chitinophagaceae bacterium]
MNTDHWVWIEEQGLRDGLQSLSLIIPTEQKKVWINKLVEAGIKKIQAVSFVHPELVPQMADAELLCEDFGQYPEVQFSALVLNTKGVERARNAGIKYLAVSLSASDTHSRKNTRKSLEEAVTEFREMVRMAKDSGIYVRGGIQCAFGCRYEGKISEVKILELIESHLQNGVDELALADSTGMGNPRQVYQLSRKAIDLCKDIPVSLHLHNTENKGYANVFAALEAGIRRFDTAFGGLGGCPFIKNATGNIATEDTVHMLHQMGMQTGIDIGKVAEVSKEVEKMLSCPLPGLVYKLLSQKENDLMMI